MKGWVTLLRTFTIITLVSALCACTSPATQNSPPSKEPSPAYTNPKCETFPTCSVSTACPGDTICVKLKACPQPICAGRENACTMECGTGAGCVVLESYPSQLACNQ